ncbi:hypothetical protein WDU94_011023 [Cyamophila willieti]
MPNKSVTFGGVFHNKSATLPNPKTQKSTPDVLETKNNDKSMFKKGFNCVGTLRNSFKMVSNNGSTLISIRLVRSKLRKREDSNLSPESGAPNTNHNNNIIPPDVVVSASAAPVEPPPFLWLYSSKNNLVPPTSTTTSSQYTLYNNDQVRMACTFSYLFACEKNFCFLKIFYVKQCLLNLIYHIDKYLLCSK